MFDFLGEPMTWGGYFVMVLIMTVLNLLFNKK